MVPSPSALSTAPGPGRDLPPELAERPYGIAAVFRNDPGNRLSLARRTPAGWTGRHAAAPTAIAQVRPARPTVSWTWAGTRKPTSPCRDCGYRKICV